MKKTNIYINGGIKMQSLNEEFDKKFGGLVIISKTKSYTEEDMKDFIRDREKALLKDNEQLKESLGNILSRVIEINSWPSISVVFTEDVWHNGKVDDTMKGYLQQAKKLLKELSDE